MKNNTELHIKQLEQEREVILTELVQLRQELKLQVDADIGEGDPGGAEREKIMSLIRLKEHKLNTILQTLQEFKEGNYGICERCGKPIDPERLAIVPETSFCVDCQRIVEQQTHSAFG